jgi:TolB-like protein/tetratricopeptide (TPR) repeat protein
MKSIIEGYEYDIFISYRQKDNKYDSWVTEFIENLKRELDATFKEEVSVYFDINPHDGILETYNVDASLKEKLKCLVFIPIISQTYCDPKSFAWQNEFIAFNRMCKEDLLGRDIKLDNGNVASRILPVKIHELDKSDIQLIENELGSVLRSIDFIFKSPGVNRPLKTDDGRVENLNHTYYRDQINKVANASKEIINAIKILSLDEVSEGSYKPKREVSAKARPKFIYINFFILAVIILAYFFITKLSRSPEMIEKSIAILPFRDDSPNDTNTYFINGIMGKILDNLQVIKEFRVISRTSVEQYRNTKKTIPEIAKELGVNYIVEGEGQKFGNKFSINSKLFEVKKEKNLWSKFFERDISVGEIFNVETQIARLIADELEAKLTTEENQLIEKTPTTSLTAWDFYQRGRDEYSKYLSDKNYTKALDKSEGYYNQALNYDSKLAQAYTGLARVYWDKHSSSDEYFSKNYMDSVLIFCNRALYLDSKLADAYTLRGDYYTYQGAIQKAIGEYDQALAINPNFPEAYTGKGFIYEQDDYVKSIDNYQKASVLNRGKEFTDLLRTISMEYASVGFLDKSKYINDQALTLDGDSSKYLDFLGFTELISGNYEKALQYQLRSYSMDTSNTDIAYDIAYTYMFQNKFELSLKYFKNNIDTLNFHRSFVIAQIHHVGWALWENGQKKRGEYYFKKQLEYSENEIMMKRPWGQKLYPYYDIAGVFAFMGDKEKAYIYLKKFNMRKTMPYWILTYMKNDPLFSSIRGEADFQQIAKEIETKYLLEHKRVEKWMTENNIL